MSNRKLYVFLAGLLLAMLLLLGGCAGNTCDPYAAYHNGCEGGRTYYNCNCGCAQGSSSPKDQRRSLFY